MIEHAPFDVVLTHDDGLWSVRHDPELAAGPAEIRINEDVLVRDCAPRIDDLRPDSAVLEKFRAYHRGGAAVVEAKGVFPFGNEIAFSHVWRYAANHVRVTTDFNWPRDCEVKRHLSLGDLFLPGRWKRFLVIPPALHLAAGAKIRWQNLPAETAAGTMIGHWHRPPLAVVFERENGNRLEVGTGSDLWRWEKSFGHGPESGSYKLVVEDTGIRFVREPLMCCLPFTPPAQQYRFTWYMAWSSPAWRMAGDFPPAAKVATDDARKIMLDAQSAQALSFLIDFTAPALPNSARKAQTAVDFIRGKTGSVPCWQCNATNRLARSLIRQMQARFGSGHIRLKGLLPQPCYVPGHVDRKNEDGIGHWDINAILDFCVWARRQLGRDWQLRIENRLTDMLPSLKGIELTNGFSPERISDDDTDDDTDTDTGEM